MPSVLLVETEPSLARRVAWILETEGYQTALAPTPAQAPAAGTPEAAGDPFDAAIVNSDSSPQEKRRIIDALRARMPHCRIVDLHPAAMVNMRHLHASGADAYIHMPFDAATLLDELARLLPPSRRSDQAG